MLQNAIFVVLQLNTFISTEGMCGLTMAFWHTELYLIQGLASLADGWFVPIPCLQKRTYLAENTSSIEISQLYTNLHAEERRLSEILMFSRIW